MTTPAVTFGAEAGFGAFVGWSLIKSAPDTKRNQAFAKGSKGDVVNTKLHGEDLNITADYECNADTNTPPTQVGVVINNGTADYALTAIKFSTGPGQAAKMTLGGHNHTLNPHAVGSLRVATHGITVPKWTGAIDFLGGTAGDDASPASGSCDITCQHKDEPNADGDHFAGENYNCQIQATTEWLGTPTTKAAAGWTVPDESGPATESEGFEKSSVTGNKNIDMTNPA